MKSAKKDLAKPELSKAELSKLCEVCEDFQDLNLESPILSMYEGHDQNAEKNVLDSFRARRKNKQVVSIMYFV